MKEKLKKPPASDSARVTAPAAMPVCVLRADELVADSVRLAVAQPHIRLIRRRVLEDVEEMGLSIDAAREHAAKILARAEDEVEMHFEQARQEGRAAGAREMLEIIASARAVYARALQDAEQDMVDMAFRLAEHIVGEALQIEPRRVERMICALLRRARGKREILVRVSPQDLENLNQLQDPNNQQSDNPQNEQFSRQVDGVAVHFEADPSLTPGGCVIETESGRVDGRIETRLEALREALID